MSDVSLGFVVEIAREAGEILFAAERNALQVEKKGHRDLVTQADKASEAQLIARIKAAFPHHRIIAEESQSLDQDLAEGPTWILDPLDGTTNFVHGIPHVAVSVGFYESGVPQAACVLNPRLDECFAAERGKGATLNGAPILCSKTKALMDAVLATGFHYQRESLPNSNVEHFRDFIYKVRGMRRLGAASLDLCYVAAGRMDGFWELSLSPWDVAAGALVAAESGALVTDFEGGGSWLTGGQIVAANPSLHKEMMRVLGSADPDQLPGPQANP